VGLCALTATPSSCVAGVETACAPGEADPTDGSCDGVDDDCDGNTDEDYLPVADCGVGACAGAGIPSSCADGVETDCVPGQGADGDATCDGLDDDCDGNADEDYAGQRCGDGACFGRSVPSACNNGQEVECVPGQPAADDATCDGEDDDCDGNTDEDYAPEGCGVGACADGATPSSCVGGEIVACVPGQAAADDATCDGVDDDCDGNTDEDYVGASCGVGACAATARCVDGAEQACEPLPAALDDITCDGVDDDCDEATDEDYSGVACGIGACISVSACVAGEVVACVPGQAAADDTTCDAVDDDCDGREDEGYVPVVDCGDPQCPDAVTPSSCAAGVETPCAPSDPAADDATCDGRDDDCDGNTDEDWEAEACGEGACAAMSACVDGVERPCQIGGGAENDPTCDGNDDDCDGNTDEDYEPTNCGTGACARQSTCVGGVEQACQPGPAAQSDPTCDGIDDDCDDAADEDYADASCGAGICEAPAQCVQGGEICAPGQPKPGVEVAGVAPNLQRSCLAGRDDGIGLEMVYDDASTLHLAHINRLSGDLVYHTIQSDGAAAREVVQAGISIFFDNEVNDVGLTLVDGEPWICAREVRENRLSLWVHDAGGWTRSTIIAAPNLGDTCELGTLLGTPVVFFQRDGALWSGTRLGANWLTAEADGLQGATVGTDAALLVGPGARLVVAHQDETNGTLRVTRNVGQVGWTTTVYGSIENRQGQRPSITPIYGDLIAIAHGVPPADVDTGSDAGWWLTWGDPTRTLTSLRVANDETGGALGAVRGFTGPQFFSRLLRRSAIFGRGDGIRVYSGLPEQSNETDLETYSGAVPPHLFLHFAAAAGPLGEVALGFVDRTSAFQGQPSNAQLCVYRPVDGDGDRLPDDLEPVWGTSPMMADTDGDGTDDGDEILAGTNPDGAGPLPAPNLPAGEDTLCDGLDEDCDGSTDEAYAPRSCGVGACARTSSCANGTEAACVPGNPAVSDPTCDGIDDDCDGGADENYVRRSCGQGVCRRQSSCNNGAEVACVPGQPAAHDASCNNRDNDCDGRTDEDYAPVVCGVGACQRQSSCNNGQETECVAGNPAGNDQSCNGIDDDCNGAVDEDFPVVICGVGACQRQSSCVEGVASACAPGDPLNDADFTDDGVDDDCDGVVDENVGVGDINCDGIDEDGDGRFDEDYAVVRCGVGACAATSSCVEGVETPCVAGQPAASDGTCDGIDDDCNGAADEDYAVVDCGVGACARSSSCDAGEETPCVPGQAAASDANCNGVDEDCSGAADEDFQPSSCGTGACAATSSCVAGEFTACAPGQPAAGDATCDGVDDDCDANTDEDYEVVESCGLGVCADLSIPSSCVEGEETACVEGDPLGAVDGVCDGVDADCDGLTDEDVERAPTDATCDDQDDDCDGAIDEDYVVDAGCGVGACANNVTPSSCIDGVETACRQNMAAPDDATCDNIDDDCDGNTDEDVVPAADDATCDGVDDDCDGNADEDWIAVECGVGGCANTSTCIAGVETACAPLDPPSPTDASCDGFDDDCSGAADEDYVPRGCGRGACAAVSRPPTTRPAMASTTTATVPRTRTTPPRRADRACAPRPPAAKVAKSPPASPVMPWTRWTAPVTARTTTATARPTRTTRPTAAASAPAPARHGASRAPSSLASPGPRPATTPTATGSTTTATAARTRAMSWCSSAASACAAPPRLRRAASPDSARSASPASPSGRPTRPPTDSTTTATATWTRTSCSPRTTPPATASTTTTTSGSTRTTCPSPVASAHAPRRPPASRAPCSPAPRASRRRATPTATASTTTATAPRTRSTPPRTAVSACASSRPSPLAATTASRSPACPVIRARRSTTTATASTTTATA
jgi:hypothetical protein